MNNVLLFQLLLSLLLIGGWVVTYVSLKKLFRLFRFGGLEGCVFEVRPIGTMVPIGYRYSEEEEEERTQEGKEIKVPVLTLHFDLLTKKTTTNEPGCAYKVVVIGKDDKRLELAKNALRKINIKGSTATSPDWADDYLQLRHKVGIPSSSHPALRDLGKIIELNFGFEKKGWFLELEPVKDPD